MSTRAGYARELHQAFRTVRRRGLRALRHHQEKIKERIKVRLEERKRIVVDLQRFELWTPSLQGWCSTN